MSGIDISLLLRHYTIACLIMAPFALGAFILLRRVVLRGIAPKPATLTVPLWRKALTGLGLAAAALSPCILLPAALTLYNPAHPGWVAFGSAAAPGAAAGSAWAYSGLFIAQALVEELFFRGITLALLGTLFYWQTALIMTPDRHRRDPAQPAARRWFQLVWLGSGVAASAVVSIAFGVVHAHNEGSTLLSLVNIGLAGFALGLLFWLQGDLSGAWAMHWLWNTLQVLAGLPVSGNVLCGPALGFGATGAVPGVLTGGNFGPEGSVVCTLMLTLAAAWLAWRGWRGVAQASGKVDCAIS